jgi:hypothetical protein
VGLGFSALTLAAVGWQSPLQTVEGSHSNDNRTAPGVLANGVLTLRLGARLGRWFPDGSGGPSLVMSMFAGAGRRTGIPAR